MNPVHTAKRNTMGAIIGVSATLMLMAALLLTSDSVADAARNGLLLCGKTLIPAIFPFLVLNGILMRLRFPEWIGQWLGKPLGKCFGIHSSCVAAILVGLFSGFPSGAASAYRIREKGLCQDRDMNRAVRLSSIAAPGFLIAGVGSGMLDSPRLGLALWLLQLAAVFSVGIGEALLFGRTTRHELFAPPAHSQNMMRIIAEALREAADAMIAICGAVLFFSILIGLVTLFPFPPIVICFLAGLLEITSGITLCASLLPPTSAFIMIAGAIGWSGFSVHAQTIMVTNGKLSIWQYLLAKALTALITALFAAAALFLGIV